MHPRWLLLASLTASLSACAVDPGAVELDPSEAGPDGKFDGAAGVPDVRCDADPVTAPAAGFRHTTSRVTTRVSSPKHRGIDLIATASEATQVLAGTAAYGLLDKALEDEDVELFACRAGAWRSLGTTRTGSEGEFALALRGTGRLPIGMRDLFISVAGDRTGGRFLALVLPAGAPLAVSDIDGTLTSSENAFGSTLVFGSDVAIHEGAPAAFRAVAAHGSQPVYMTARPRLWTEPTRAWLAAKGMPRGPLRLSPSVVLGADATTAYKASALEALGDFELALGNGNRASDIAAYTAAGIPADRIFVKLPEYTDELAAPLAAGEATGFAHYDELRAIVDARP